MSLACLDTLVGLSATDNDCWSGDAPDGFDTSDSGYYLTDNDFGITVMTGVSIDGWGILQAAREQAIRELKTDLLAAIRQRFDSALYPFSGWVGKLKHTGTRSVSNDFVGIRIRARRQKGVRLVLTEVRIGLDATGSKDVSVTSNDPLFEQPDDLTVAHTADTFSAETWPDGGISLPLWSETNETDYIEYYVGFDRDGALPLNNKIWCCAAAPEWKNHFDASGFSANSATPETGGSFTSVGNGMAIKAYLTCDNLDWLCELETLNGYYLLDVVARAIQQRAAAIACGTLLETPQISVGSGFNAQVLTDRRNFLNPAYAEKVKWIAENLPSKGVTDCFKCKPSNSFHKSKILV